jgi:CRISPR/Cas system-associated exonuclease Cas4 (RecB family)
MSDKWVRASEISEYVYCRRAWWLKHVEGQFSKNVTELKSGTSYHEEHGRLLSHSIWIRRAAYVMLFCMVAVLTYQILMNG